MLKGVTLLILLVIIVFAFQTVILTNTTKKLIYSSKKTALLNEAETIASSMNSNSQLTVSLASEVMDVLGINASESVTITDSDGIVLYSSQATIPLGSIAIFPEIVSALHGNDTFRCIFKDEIIYSYGSIPIIASGEIVGAVMLTETDSEQPRIVLLIQQNVMELAVFFLILGLVIYLIFAVITIRKNNRMLSTIQIVQEGDYSYRADVVGKDEFAVLATAFNELAERLEKNEQLRRQFVSDASHELRTPLAAIRLLSDSIIQNEMDVDTIKEFVQDISGEADRLTRMTTKLLNLSSLDSKNFEQQTLSPVDVGQCCKKTVRLLKPLAAEHGCAIEESSEDHCYVYATEDDIFQLILNLAENAIKYSGNDGNVRILAYAQSEQVIIIVDDNGIGIPEEEQGKIFERFYRVDKARSRAAGGTGLGLSIVKDTVEKYGGSVAATNRPQGGARFTVSLPLFEMEESI